MTVCAYISPNMNPAISTDIVVTSDLAPPAPRPGETVNYIPSTQKIYRHVRKNFIMSPQTCISVAGEYSSIYRFLRECEDNLHIFEMHERPASLIGELASKIGGMNTISSYVNQNLDENHCFPTFTSISSDVKEIGVNHIMGSGANRLKRFIDIDYGDSIRSMHKNHMNGGIFDFRSLGYDEEYSEFLRQKESAVEITRGIFSAISSKFLFLDMFGLLSGSTYGGFTEFSYFDYRNRVWARQPAQAFFFYEVNIDGKTANISISDRFFLYDPGERHGLLLSFHKNGVDVHKLIDVIYSEDEIKDFDLINYNALTATATFLGRRNNGQPVYLGSRSTQMHEVDDILIDGKNSVFGLRASWFERYRDELISNFGKLFEN